jgi:hypothetical protein
MKFVCLEAGRLSTPPITRHLIFYQPSHLPRYLGNFFPKQSACFPSESAASVSCESAAQPARKFDRSVDAWHPDTSRLDHDFKTKPMI